MGNSFFSVQGFERGRKDKDQVQDRRSVSPKVSEHIEFRSKIKIFCRPMPLYRREVFLTNASYHKVWGVTPETHAMGHSIHKGWCRWEGGRLSCIIYKDTMEKTGERKGGGGGISSQPNGLPLPLPPFVVVNHKRSSRKGPGKEGENWTVNQEGDHSIGGR